MSYFNNLHSTAAIEGLGGRVINSLHTAIFCGNKLFTHMELLNSVFNPLWLFAHFQNHRRCLLLINMDIQRL